MMPVQGIHVCLCHYDAGMYAHTGAGMRHRAHGSLKSLCLDQLHPDVVCACRPLTAHFGEFDVHTVECSGI